MGHARSRDLGTLSKVRARHAYACRERERERERETASPRPWTRRSRPRDLFANILHKPPQLREPDPHLEQIALAMLAKAPADRLCTVDALRATAFFQPLDFDALPSKRQAPPFVPDIAKIKAHLSKSENVGALEAEICEGAKAIKPSLPHKDSFAYRQSVASIALPPRRK